MPTPDQEAPASLTGSCTAWAGTTKTHDPKWLLAAARTQRLRKKEAA